MNWQCRWSPTLGELEGTHREIWKTEDYSSNEAPTVFFGVYGLPDFYALWRHKGQRAILWAGSDIQHLKDGYWLEGDRYGWKLEPRPICGWINDNCESWVENEVEKSVLGELGINVVGVVPSFLGDVNAIQPSYTYRQRPRVYASVSGDNFEMYGWDTIERVASSVPEVDFFLYGSGNWTTKHPNVVVRGRVPKEIMNKEIETMQCALRLNEFDGCSEIVVKGALRGQEVISRMPYPFVTTFKKDSGLIYALKQLPKKKKSSYAARKWFLENLNKYPWVS